MAVFWDTAPCSLAEVDGHWRFLPPCVTVWLQMWEQVDEAEPWPTGYCNSTQFFSRGLLITLLMEAVSTSETSVYFYTTTQRNIPEGCHLHTRRRGNLNSHRHEPSGYKKENLWPAMNALPTTQYRARWCWDVTSTAMNLQVAKK
jgi:hypothetical protein